MKTKGLLKSLWLLVLFFVVGMVKAQAQNVAKIGTTEFATLDAAFNAAQSGDVITLLSDVTLTGKVTAKANVTFDGANHTVTGPSKLFYFPGDVIVKNITLNPTKVNDECVEVPYANPITMTWENVKTNGDGCTHFITMNQGFYTFKNCEFSNYQYFVHSDGVENKLVYENCKFACSYGCFLGNTGDTSNAGNKFEGSVEFTNCEFNSPKLQIISFNTIKYTDCVFNDTRITMGLSAHATNPIASLSGCNLYGSSYTYYNYAYNKAGTYDISSNYWGGTAKPEEQGAGSGVTVTNTGNLSAANPNAGVMVASSPVIVDVPSTSEQIQEAVKIEQEEGAPEATTEEKAAATAAVTTVLEEISNNTATTAEEATNIADVESVTTLKIVVKSVAVEAKTVAAAPVATITKVTYDVQPMKDEAPVNEIEQVLTFRLPVPQSFKGSSVKVSHLHNGVTASTVENVKGEGANKYVELASDKFSEWTLEDVDPAVVAYVIASAQDLVTLSAMVNAGNSFAGKTVKLANNIDMSSVANFAPIGASGKMFSGTFDGQNNTISNLKVSASANYAGLFGSVFSATIKNVKLADAIVENTGENYSALLVGGGYANIENCEIIGGSVTGTDQVGAVIGYLSCGSVKNCTIDGVTVTANGDRAGGITGKANVDSQYDIVDNTIKNSAIVATNKVGEMRSAAALVGQVMASASNHWTITGNNIINVTTKTGEDATFVPVGEFRSGQFQADAVTASHIVRNHWEPATEPDSYAMANPTDASQFVTIVNFWPVAQIVGGLSYASLAEAVAAVPTDGTATTIKMLADAELSSALTIANTQNITLDLNGNTVKNAESKSLSQLITVSGQLTIDDSSDDKAGKIQNTASGKYVIKTSVAAAVLTLKNGTIETTTGNSNGAVYGTNGAFVMTGGKIIAAGTGVTSKNVNISGGEILATAGQALCAAGTITAGMFTSVNNNAVYANQSGTLEITGGNFVGVSTKPTINIYTTNVKVTGATLANGVGFASNATAMILPGSDEANLTATHAEFYEEETLVGYAPINTGLFANGKVSGKIVKLTKDVATTTYLNVTKSFTLDLNAHNIVCTPAKADAAILTKGTASAPVVLTIKGEGEVSCGDHGEGCNALQVSNYATVNIEGGELSVSGDNSTIYMLATAGNSVVNISGGEFKSGDGKYVLNIKDDARDYNTFNVTGGKFVGFNPADNIAEGEHTNFVAEGYVSVNNGDGTYTVVKFDNVAMILTYQNGNVQFVSKDAPEITINDVDGLYKKVQILNDLPNVAVNYTRRLTLTHEAWYVPFDYTVQPDDNVTFLKIWSLEIDPETGLATDVIAKKLDAGSVVKANTPYIVRATSEDVFEEGEEFANVDLHATGLKQTAQKSIWCETTERRYTFTGTYQALDLVNNPYWSMDNGAFCYWNSDDCIENPFRFILRIFDKETGAVIDPHYHGSLVNALRIKVLGEDDATGIPVIGYEDGDAVTSGFVGKCYDVSGRRVKSPIKAGIYILNGKKIIK